MEIFQNRKYQMSITRFFRYDIFDDIYSQNHYAIINVSITDCLLYNKKYKIKTMNFH